MTTTAKISLSVVVLLAIILALRLYGVFDVPAAMTSQQQVHTSLIQYNNDKLGFAISYPQGWSVEQKNGNILMITAPSPADAVISVLVSDNNTASLAGHIDNWQKIIQQKKQANILDSKRPDKFWDYYLEWECVSDDWQDIELHSEEYFKQIAHRMYVVSTSSPKATYGSYPFTEIIGSFKLITK